MHCGLDTKGREIAHPVCSIQRARCPRGGVKLCLVDKYGQIEREGGREREGEGEGGGGGERERERHTLLRVSLDLTLTKTSSAIFKHNHIRSKMSGTNCHPEDINYFVSLSQNCSGSE